MPQKSVTLSGDAPPDPHVLTRRSPTNGKELEDGACRVEAILLFQKDRSQVRDSSCLPREASLAKLTGCQRKLIALVLPRLREFVCSFE